MIYIIIVLALLLTIITIKYCLYRRQIKEICRQLSFVIENDTNKGFTSFISTSEIIELERLINEMNENAKNDKISYKRKDRQLKEALANVSHDIRTPLTSLKGYFELLRVEENVEKQLEYGAIMEERMDNLSELLEELFAYTRLQNDDYEIELSEINLTKPVLDTLFGFYEAIEAKRLEPEIEVYDGPVMINGNELAIKRIISNIIKNALVHGNGELKINYWTAKVGEVTSKGSGLVCFECSNSVDNPKDIDVAQIFDRFYKADKARSKISTGLGLAIAKASVEKMNGVIEARLEDNLFTISVSFKII